MFPTVQEQMKIIMNKTNRIELVNCFKNWAELGCRYPEHIEELIDTCPWWLYLID